MTRIVAEMPGRIRSITGIEKARRMEGVVDVECTKDVGDVLTVSHTNDDRFGYIISVGETRDKARQLGVKALEVVDVDVQKDSKVDF